MTIRNMNPMIYERTKDGEIYYDVFSRLVRERIIFLAEDINAEVASAIAATLFMLDSQNDEDDISLYINCAGGTVEDGLFVIYDMMNLIKAPVKTVCIGEAASAAAIILAAGSKGKRFALPNSRIMIHQVQVSNVSGSGTDIENEAKSVKYLKKKLTETLARHTGQPPRKVEADCEIDNYMNAEEALAYGIIDKILPPTKEIPELVKKAVKVAKKATKKYSLPPPALPSTGSQ